jgi:hypothetical protein
MTLQSSTIPPGEPGSSPQPGRGAVRDCGGGPRCEVCRTRRAEAVCAECHMLLCGDHDALLVPRIVLDLHDFLRRRGSSTRRNPTDVASSAETGAPSAAGRGAADRDAGPSRGRTSPERARAGQSAFAERSAGTKRNAGTARDGQPPPSRAPGQPAALLSEEHRWRRSRDRTYQDEVHLCPECLPWDRWTDPEVAAGVLTALLGLLGLLVGVLDAMWPPLVVGVVLTTTGIARALTRWLRARPAERTRSRLTRPVRADLRVRAVRHVENVEVKVELFADGHYERSLRRISGRIEVDAHWSRAQLPTGGIGDLPLRAGHVVLAGPAAARFVEAPGTIVRDDVAVTLAPRPSDHPVLTGSGSGRDARWPITLRYTVGTREPSPENRLRVDVTPTLVPGADKHGLDLDISWTSADERRFRPGPALMALDRVQLDVPARWGRIELDDDIPGTRAVIEESPDEGMRRITWVRIPVRPETGVQGRHRLTLHVARPIKPADEIRGRIEARFRGAVSGATGATLHFAGGAQRPDFRPAGVASRNVSPTTVVGVCLRLSLRNLKYQQIRKVPDRIRAEDYGPDARFDGIAPSHETVASLSDALGDGNYYVRRVVENTPQPGRGRSVARSWAIAGRRYSGVHPIDFDLAVVGEEPSVGSSTRPWLMATLAVSGAYVSDDVRDRVDREREHLWKLICDELRDDGPGDRAGQADGDGDEDVRSGCDAILDLLDRARRDARLRADAHEELVAHIRRAFGDDDEGGAG